MNEDENPAPESQTEKVQNAPQTEPEQTENETDCENAPDEPAEDSDNKEDGEEKPADNKDEKTAKPKWELKATDSMEEMILAHLRANATPELMAKIEKKGKTIQGACLFCKEWAMRACVTKEQLNAGKARGFMGVMGKDEDLLAQSMKYFSDDSLNCEKKAYTPPKYTPPTGNYKPLQIPKPAPKKPDPQMTLFDF